MKSKKTILYLHRYPIEYESVLYPATRRILDKLSKKYRVVYVSFKPAGKPNASLRKGVLFRELPYSVDRKDAYDKWKKTLIWYWNARKLDRLIREFKPSCIVHKEQLPFIPLYLRKKGIPLLVDIGDWWWTTLFGRTRGGMRVAQKVENVGIRSWGKSKNLFVTTHSQTEAATLVKRGMDPSRIYVVNHPSSDEVFRPVQAADIRKKLDFKKGDWVVAVHGIIHPSKAYDQLLVWWQRVVRAHQNWKLLIIGGTIGEKWCKNEIRRLGIQKNTIMTGWLKDVEEVNRYLNAADCLLVTRRNDLANQGLIPSSLFHSLSIGKPLVITGLPGLSEIVVNGINGYSFTPDSYDSFKSTLEEIYNYPQKAKKIGRKGIARGRECFDPEKCAEGFVGVIDRAVRESDKNF